MRVIMKLIIHARHADLADDFSQIVEAVKSIELQIRKIHEKSKSKDRDLLRFKKPS